MTNADSSPHIYQRIVSKDEDDSLRMIADLIEPGKTLLDLGMGTGGLGQYLSQRGAIVADGVTLSPAEAEIAKAWYRRSEVADLDRINVTELFEGQRYDFIVCADVLEHLKEPQILLTQCKMLLMPGGRLISSVPNVGYCGLIAELIEGDFRYRPEGLLDRTHLHFFTRSSLKRFFFDNGWVAESTLTVRRALPNSEFNARFDSLPPAVARYLLAAPDALTYQFVSVLQPGDMGQLAMVANEVTTASAQFSAMVYLATGGQYDESVKLTVAGSIGNPKQMLVFDIPANADHYTSIRLDPADRAGFFRLYSIKVTLPQDAIAWQWQANRNSLAELLVAPHQQMLLAGPWTLSDSALMLLHGDDPWLELPISAQVLQQISANGARLEVEAGWPMSSDYLQASQEINSQQARYEKSLTTAQLSLAETRNLLSLRTHELAILQQDNALRNTELNQLVLKCKHHEDAALESQRALMIARSTVDATRAERQKLTARLAHTTRDKENLDERVKQLELHLQSIERSTLFRSTRPIVKLKMRIDKLFSSASGLPDLPAASADLHLNPIHSNGQPVDIIVPVYRGLTDTRRCLESVLTAPCKVPWRLVVINDYSPEPEVGQWLRDLAQREPRVLLLENTENLGFVGTVNRGMALSADNDVLLLNSDTEVANDWLDRLQKAAYSQGRVASVTPFSNNATICSYPHFCRPNELPNGFDTSSLDRLFARHLADQAIEIPTGVGFCMYIRRQSLREVGLFDTTNFGKGYGEENDFCVRAHAAGWVHLHALDTFVRHAGGISFGYSKGERELQAMETLRRLHPQYERNVMEFVARDSARSSRMTIDIARIVCHDRPVILNVIHDREGGTVRHIEELAQRIGHKATFLRLTPAPRGVVLRLEGTHEAFALHFSLPQDNLKLLETLRLLQVGHIHYHHLLGHASSILDLSAQLGVSHDFTAHDFFSFCPQISLTDHTDRYCGEFGLTQCHQCLQRNPAPGGVSIEAWRESHARLLVAARFVIAPSVDAARRLRRFVPAANVIAVPHALLAEHTPEHPEPCPKILPNTARLKVVVLGALSKIKGADVLEEVATLAAEREVDIDFHLIGYAYRSLRTQPKARLTVHGAYDDNDLAQLLQWLQPDAIWFPAVWPETYSYTLSASLDSGLPIVAPAIGAFSERLLQRPWTWLCDWQQTGAQWLDFFVKIRAENFCTGTGPLPTLLATTDNLESSAGFSYQDSYLQSLPSPTAIRSPELMQIQQQLAQNLHWLDTRTAPGNALKLSTLRTIVRLRASAMLSPMARLVPTHFQRRVKSWLGQ